MRQRTTRSPSARGCPDGRGTSGPCAVRPDPSRPRHGVPTVSAAAQPAPHPRAQIVNPAKAVCPPGCIALQVVEHDEAPEPPIRLQVSWQSRYPRHALPDPHAASWLGHRRAVHELQVKGASGEASWMAPAPASPRIVREASRGIDASPTGVAASSGSGSPVVPASSSETKPAASSSDAVVVFGLPASVASRPCESRPHARAPEMKSSDAVAIGAGSVRINFSSWHADRLPQTRKSRSLLRPRDRAPSLARLPRVCDRAGRCIRLPGRDGRLGDARHPPRRRRSREPDGIGDGARSARRVCGRRGGGTGVSHSAHRCRCPCRGGPVAPRRRGGAHLA